MLLQSVTSMRYLPLIRNRYVTMINNCNVTLAINVSLEL